MQALSLPSWIPGSYLLREFARHVVAIEAGSAGRPVPIVKISKNRWRTERPGAGPLDVSVTVYALDESVRGAFLDTRRGYFNGACLLLLDQSAVGFRRIITSIHVYYIRIHTTIGIY